MPKPNNRLYGFPNTGYKNWIIGFGVSVKNLEFGISFRDSFRVCCSGRVFGVLILSLPEKHEAVR
jgi:hypothetical protein